ncbi:AAA family ATPase [Enhygromyxa salina]|nr:AAA family ATPase [Enhygromyxa salina]
MDDRTTEHLSFSEVCEKYPEYLPAEIFGLRRPVDEWLTNLLRSVSTQFIETQRLRKRRPPSEYGREESDHAVERLAQDLSRRIKDSIRDSGTVGASLDRTFPKRILEGTLPAHATEESIRARYKQVELTRGRLMTVGLLDAEEQVPLPETTLDQAERKVLWFYLEDVEKKFHVHQPLLERAELFKMIIDAKRFLHKSMELSRDDGFRFVSEGGHRVALELLSSGEQHEVVLTYELLFSSRGKQLILIDEPELSLHVVWQRKFLRDMQRIAQVADLDFVIATHSPAIIGDRDDLMVGLSG